MYQDVFITNNKWIFFVYCIILMMIYGIIILVLQIKSSKDAYKWCLTGAMTKYS